MNEVAEQVQVQNAEVASNLVNVIFPDGSTEIVNFGKSGKVFASYDVETSTLTFKLITGVAIVHKIEGIEGLTPFLKEVVLYGIREKIKTTLAPVKDEDKESKILRELEAIKNENFTTRSSDTSVALDNFMKAFALINATGCVNCGTGTVAVDPAFIVVDELKPHWANTTDVGVINEVKAYWNGLDRKVKAAQKRNTFIKTQEIFIANGTVVA